MQKVYLCYANADSVEGRGPDILLQIFTHAPDAEQWVRDNDPYGGTAGKVKDPWSRSGMAYCIPFIVTESYDEIAAVQCERVRQQALRKLTPQERAALDLPDPN